VGTVLNLNPDAGTTSSDGSVTAPPDFHQAILGVGVTAADVTRFETAMPGSCTGPTINYPLDGAVMPRNVYPPKIMWTPSGTTSATDLYRVRLKRPNATLEGYFLNPPQMAWQPPVDSFSPLANRNVGEPIELTVAVLTGAGVCVGSPIAFKTVDAFIAGSVYYWAPNRVDTRQIMRVDVDKGMLVDFMPNPGGCLACHGVTRDGRRMAAYQSTLRGTFAYDLTANLTGSPPPSLFSTALYRESLSTFNGDGTRLLLSFDSSPRVRDSCGGAFELYSGTDGAPVTSTGLTQVTNGTDPEWSPDSTTIAFSDNGSLKLLPQTGPDQFGAVTTLGGSGNYDWHPTWSPDSQWLAYQHGTSCNTGTRSGGYVSANLWIISRNGTGNAVLAKLNGGRMDNWRPVFSPFDSGGYFWVVYSAARPYGNALGGVSGKKQLWIAAIHDQPSNFSDPSEVPYYLDGQELYTNLQAYWAPAPCQVYAGWCETDGQCCSGACTNGSCGVPVTCRVRGQTCAVSTDCCAGDFLECMGGLCDMPIIR
jgi:hypothetical protein